MTASHGKPPTKPTHFARLLTDYPLSHVFESSRIRENSVRLHGGRPNSHEFGYKETSLSHATYDHRLAPRTLVLGNRLDHIGAVRKPPDCYIQLRSPAFHKAGLLLFSLQCELRPGVRGTPPEVSLNRGRAQKMFRTQPGISPAWMHGDDNRTTARPANQRTST